MRKSDLIFGLLIGILLSISMASALNNCLPSQTILKLASTTNAHVETASSSLYSTRLCYDEVFGVNYTLPNPQTCTGSNLVAKLAQSTNSHIEGPAGTAFTVQVCYADLSCTLRSGACQLNEVQLLSLAQSTNAHAAMNNAFPFKLCCSSAFAVANTNSTTNTTNGTGLMSLVIVSPTNLATYNNSVLLSVTATNASAVLYNLGAANFSYLSPINLSLANGSYTLNVYALNSTTMIQQSRSFTIVNSSTIATNNTNNTNTTNGTGTGLMSFTINRPQASVTYNASVPINITSANASSLLYTFGNGNLTYTVPLTIPLANGSYTFTLFVSNSTTMLQQSVLFNITNSSLPLNSTLPGNTTTNNTTPGGNTTTGGNGGGGSSGGGSSSSGRGVGTGTTIVNQMLPEQAISGDEPIELGDNTSAKKSTINLSQVFQGLLILFVLILLIVVIAILVRRNSQSRNKRL